MTLIFESSSQRQPTNYGDRGNQRQLYQHLFGLSRQEILAVYGDSPQGLAVAMRYAVELQVQVPFGDGDLRTTRQFMASAASAADPRVQSFLDVVMPSGQPSRARLPLAIARRDFGEILTRLVTLDRDYRGRVLLMRSFLILAEDHGLLPERPR